MTPNADRDNQNRIPINQETYLMTNMVPQAPDNNQGPWAAFEGYLRTVTEGGKEVYIISGPSGIGVVALTAGTTTTIAGGNVTVPASTWKVVLFCRRARRYLPRGLFDQNNCYPVAQYSGHSE
jgi:endonuclease G